MVPKLRHFEE